MANVLVRGRSIDGTVWRIRAGGVSGWSSDMRDAAWFTPYDGEQEIERIREANRQRDLDGQVGHLCTVVAPVARWEQRDAACKALGVEPNAPLPAGPLGPVMMALRDGFTAVRLATREQARVQRVQGQCPVCDRWFSLGNLTQHKRTCRW